MITHKDFKLPWAMPVSIDKWKRFLSHTFTDISRIYIYEVIKSFLERDDVEFPIDFAEIGFGQAYDFINCTKSLHDQGKIRYTGYEITEQFVKYAKEIYSNYNFIVGGFSDLKKNSFDVTYARHVFEHLSPLAYQQCLKDLLYSTKRLCIITWFVPPRGIERFIWEEKTGWNNSGAYVNAYSKNKIIKIIEDAGFIYQEKKEGIYELMKG